MAKKSDQPTGDGQGPQELKKEVVTHSRLLRLKASVETAAGRVLACGAGVEEHTDSLIGPCTDEAGCDKEDTPKSGSVYGQLEQEVDYLLVTVEKLEYEVNRLTTET